MQLIKLDCEIEGAQWATNSSLQVMEGRSPRLGPEDPKSVAPSEPRAFSFCGARAG
jgi:hypothetical protein